MRAKYDSSVETNDWSLVKTDQNDVENRWPSDVKFGLDVGISQNRVCLLLKKILAKFLENIQ